ncbi:acyl carrier protein [Streptomyces shenzhenensis]|uniref:acyl carrier protein n=1 Tax=Streptomyces shenzhenensis TaxID=943815 RepID=UPI001F339CCB|nr:acyl carrier protein [Streptomyces shenzhenensis]
MPFKNPPSPLADETKNTIKEIVCDILEIEDDEMTDVSLFIDEHDMDSLRAIEILAAIEKRLNVTIEQEEMARMVNLEGVYAVVEQAARN